LGGRSVRGNTPCFSFTLNGASIEVIEFCIAAWKKMFD